ncbi:MAG TPA: hypothetical protein VFA20_29835, partial [Myxococcaceae bacterium]|nr:hypothetical protein [Myxococcaceae bacterium]
VWMTYAQPPFPSTAYWAPDPNQSHNPPNPFTVDVDRSFPKGAAFADWLWDAGVSTTFGKLDVTQTRHDVAGTGSGPTSAWLSALNPTADGGFSVQQLTFNTPYYGATQCGRVAYSDYHMTPFALIFPGANGVFPHDCAGGPMTAQEKALAFMLFDLTSCVQSDQLPPRACQRHDDPCASSTDCCSGFTCQTATQSPCAGGACTCQ